MSSTRQKFSSPDEEEHYQNSTTGQNKGTHTNTMTGGEVPVESVAIIELSGNTDDAVISVITENL
eukprot:10052018-Ditylum_brightwellii.AAC.1